MKFKEFVVSMFSEEPGVISFSRVATAVLISFVLGWDTSVIIHTHALPDAVTLAGQAAFFSSLYAVNRTAGILDSKTEGK